MFQVGCLLGSRLLALHVAGATTPTPQRANGLKRLRDRRTPRREIFHSAQDAAARPVEYSIVSGLPLFLLAELNIIFEQSTQFSLLRPLAYLKLSRK